MAVVDSSYLDRWVCRRSDSCGTITASAPACIAGDHTWPVDCLCLGNWNFRIDLWTRLAGFQSFSRRAVAEMATRLVDDPLGNWLLNRIASSSRDHCIFDAGST